jgi:hypothetical protein
VGVVFNFDYHVSFTPEEVAKGKAYNNYEVQDGGIDELSGRSVFFKDAAGAIFHTYSSYARGGDPFLGAYHYLDITPKGRNETGPGHNLTDWCDVMTNTRRGPTSIRAARRRGARPRPDCDGSEDTVRLDSFTSPTYRSFERSTIMTTMSPVVHFEITADDRRRMASFTKRPSAGRRRCSARTWATTQSSPRPSRM